MPRTANTTGRSLTKGTFALIPENAIRSPGYAATSLAARALLIEISVLYRGTNNGFLGLSIRQAAERLGCSKDTASRGFKELEAHGLISPMFKGRFETKTDPRASEWRLNWRPCNRANQLPSHAYLHWTPTAGQAGSKENERSDLREIRADAKDSISSKAA